MIYNIQPTKHNLHRGPNEKTNEKTWYKVEYWVHAPWNGSFPYHRCYFETKGLVWNEETQQYSNLFDIISDRIVNEYGQFLEFDVFSVRS